MADEIFRKTARKRIKLQNGTVDVPVIALISFVDPIERYQESQHTIDNSAKSDRDVHVASIPGDGAATDETGQNDGLKVERIDIWRNSDAVERAQETFFAIDNKTIQQPPNAPPYFTTHLSSHVVRYVNTPDDGNWIDSELIDQFSVIDPVDRYQETVFNLANPPDNTPDGVIVDQDAQGRTIVAVDPGLSEISDSDNGVDPPWRLDPFQNIVDCSAGAPEFFIRFRMLSITGIVTATTDTGVSINDPRPDGPPPSLPSGSTMDGSYFINFSIEAIGHSQAPVDGIITVGTGPTVTLSKSSWSFDQWKYTAQAGWNIGSAASIIWDSGQINPGHGVTPATPPLLVNGKPIPGFTSAMGFTLTPTAVPFDSGPYTFDDLAPPGHDIGTWWMYTGGIFTRGNNQSLGDITLTISPAPFAFNGKNWRCVGMAADISITIPEIGSPGPGPSSPTDLLLWCIPA
jgi:hypothetical protein